MRRFLIALIAALLLLSQTINEPVSASDALYDCPGFDNCYCGEFDPGPQ